MNRNFSAEAPGIYVHIPFCRRKCPYCDFYSLENASLLDVFTDALIREISAAPAFASSPDTLYFGGGTPSLLPAREIGRIIRIVRERRDLSSDSEITLEANPGTVDPGRFSAYRAAGVNRINIGVQSFNDAELRFLGRIHTAREARLSMSAARLAGFGNVGIDLIYGLPGQSRSDLIENLKEAVSFSPEHLSCYLLSYESGTALTEKRRKGEIDPLSENRRAALFKTAVEFLSDAGYPQYEISSFSRGAEWMSRHNRKYWNNVPYLGFGPSAHSYFPPERRWNHRDLDLYLAEIASGTRAVENREILTRENRMTEAIYLGLRQTEGIDLARFEAEFGVTFPALFGPLLEQLSEKKLLLLTSERCALTLEGELSLEGIAALLTSNL
jgi:oxygen-independent coproporphyrinogen III oxidase